MPTLRPNRHQAGSQTQKERREYGGKATKERQWWLGWEQRGPGWDPQGTQPGPVLPRACCCLL